MASVEDWFGALANALEDVGDEIGTVFIVANAGQEACEVFSLDESDELSDLNPYIFNGVEHEALGMANRIDWSPTADGESSPAWVGVVVKKAGIFGPLPAFFGVKRHVEDDTWWRLDGSNVPWFLASTAGALRHALDNGKPLTVREAAKDSDPKLFEGVQPDGSNAPRLHWDGMI